MICASGNRRMAAAGMLGRAGIDAYSVAGGTAMTHLLGRTRAAVLSSLTRVRSTSEPAARLGISAVTASHHLNALRESGLITTVRPHGATRHSLTHLGLRLLHDSSHTPMGPPGTVRQNHAEAGLSGLVRPWFASVDVLCARGDKNPLGRSRSAVHTSDSEHDVTSLPTKSVCRRGRPFVRRAALPIVKNLRVSRRPRFVFVPCRESDAHYSPSSAVQSRIPGPAMH